MLPHVFIFFLPHRPDMTFAVDWALKTDYLSKYLPFAPHQLLSFVIISICKCPTSRSFFCFANVAEIMAVHVCNVMYTHQATSQMFADRNFERNTITLGLHQRQDIFCKDHSVQIHILLPYFLFRFCFLLHVITTQVYGHPCFSYQQNTYSTKMKT